MKQKLMKIMLFVATVALGLVLGMENATAQLLNNPLAVSGVQINSLSEYKGQYLTVYYTNSQAAGIGLDPEHIKIVRAYIVLKNIPIITDSMNLTPQSITWVGTEKPNLLVLVVHPTPDYLWVNGDRSMPELPGGMIASGTSNRSAVSTVSIRFLDRLPRVNGVPSFDFGSMTPSGSVFIPAKMQTILNK